MGVSGVWVFEWFIFILGFHKGVWSFGSVQYNVVGTVLDAVLGWVKYD